MKNCSMCKYACYREDFTYFCDVALPPWIYKLIPISTLDNLSQDVDRDDTCVLWEHL